MRLGGPVFVQTDDPEELALAHRKLGYRAAYCPPARLDQPERIRALREAFRKHDVAIAEVGVWNNLMEADQATRQANLKAVIEGLARAEEVGARCVVNIAGSRNPGRWDGPHPDNFSAETFDLAVANAREIIDAVRPQRTKFTYEMMPWAFPDGADSYLALIRAIDRAAFGVHLDVVNAVNSVDRYFNTTALIRDCVIKLGPHIASCHLKDVRLSEDLTVHLDEVRAGEGNLDIRTYLEEVHRLPQEPPMMLEHLASEEEYDAARRYVLGLAKELGVE